MQITTYLANLLGKTHEEASQLYTLVDTGEGPFVDEWLSTNVPKPTPQDLATALSQPDPPPSAQDLLAYASSKQDAVLAEIWTFHIGSLTLTTKLDAEGQASMLELLSWGKLLAEPTDTQAYNMADGSPGPSLTPDQAVSLAQAAGAVKSQTFLTLNQVAAGITASPPSFRSLADIDGASWPSPSP